MFDGYNSIIEASNVSGLNNATAVSASLWFNWDDSASVSNYGHLINIGTGTLVNGDYFGLAIGDDGGTFNRVLYGYFPEGSSSTGQTVKPNAWHHAVIVHEGTSVKYYYNGNLIATHTKTSLSLPSSGNNITIGEYAYNGSHHFKGQIDQVRIYDAALTSDQVTELYNEKPEVDTSNFKTVLYTGNGGTQYISNVGMDLETNGGLIWFKNRDQTDTHRLHDSIRGITKYVSTSSTGAQVTISSGGPQSFDSNGFTTSSGHAYNATNEDYVAWVWKGGGDAVLNEQGSVNSQVSANTDAGFSIVKYTGNGSGNNTSTTVGHGLSSAPELVIAKILDTSGNWQIQYAKDSDNLAGSFTTSALGNHSAVVPTSTVFNPYYANTSNNFITYCFHSVSGYSKIGSYSGSSSSQRIYVTDDGTSSGSGGFEPSWVMIKRTDSIAANWIIYDKPRGNGDIELYLDSSSNESNTSSVRGITFQSDGFTLDNSHSAYNTSGGDFIYMAFK